MTKIAVGSNNSNSSNVGLFSRVIFSIKLSPFSSSNAATDAAKSFRRAASHPIELRQSWQKQFGDMMTTTAPPISAFFVITQIQRSV